MGKNIFREKNKIKGLDNRMDKISLTLVVFQNIVIKLEKIFKKKKIKIEKKKKKKTRSTLIRQINKSSLNKILN